MTIAAGTAAIVVAAILPVQSTADWLNPAFNPVRSDVVLGVVLFKVVLSLLGIFAMALSRLHSPRGDDSRSGGRSDILFLTAIVVFALVLRLTHVDTELWLDEILMKTRYIPLDFPQLISTYDTQNHQPLYTLLARLSSLALGGADWTLRFPAILFGVASLVALWTLGRRITSGPEALLATLTLAVSYHHVWFSQNARGYTATMFFAIASSTLFIRLCEGRGDERRLAWCYAIVMALATYTHLTGALIAVGHALALVFTTSWLTSERRRALWPSLALVLSAVITVTLYAFMLPQVYRKITEPPMAGVDVAWTGVGWMAREAMRVLSAGIPGGLLTVSISLFVLGVGVVSYWRQTRLVTLVMFLPVVVTLTAIVGSGHNLWPRYFFFAGGFFVLAAIRGGFVVVHALVRWHPDRVAIAGASAVALLSVLTVPAAWRPKQQFRAAYDFVEQERQPGDNVVALVDAAQAYSLLGWAPQWHLTMVPGDIDPLERSATRTWVVYTLGVRLRAMAPSLYERLTSPRYQEVRVFPSTVGGGEIHVLRYDQTSVHD